MTTRGITRRASFGASQRRPRQWGITHANGAIIAATQAAALIINLGTNVEASLGQTMSNWTISAIRMRLDFIHQATCVAGDRAVGAWGITLVGSDAFAAGTASLPDPSSDDADWIAYGGFNLVTPVTAVINKGQYAQEIIVNNSMRKVRENNQVLMLIVRGTLVDDPISVFISGRTLFLLR